MPTAAAERPPRGQARATREAALSPVQDGRAKDRVTALSSEPRAWAGAKRAVSPARWPHQHHRASAAFGAEAWERGVRGASGTAPLGKDRYTEQGLQTDGPTGPGTRGTRPDWPGPFCSQRTHQSTANVHAHGRRRKLPLRPSSPACHEPRPGTARCCADGDPVVGELKDALERSQVDPHPNLQRALVSALATQKTALGSAGREPRTQGLLWPSCWVA